MLQAKRREEASASENEEKAVSVRSYDPPPPSPHLLDLRRGEGQPRITVDPYMEEAPEGPVCATIDFAALVRGSKKAQPRVRKRFQLKIPTFRMPTVNVRAALRPYSAIVAGAILLASIPIPAVLYAKQARRAGNQVILESTNGFLALQASTVAVFQTDIAKSEAELTRALRAFASARGILDSDHRWLFYALAALPILGESLQSHNALLSAGEHVALGNTYLLKGANDAQSAANVSMSDRMRMLYPYLRAAIAQYRAADQAFRRVSSRHIPVEHQAAFGEFRTMFAMLVDDVADIAELLEAMEVVLGGDSFRRYLVVFQNSYELRPTGGFMGSYGILDVQKGKVIRFDIPPGGTYDIKGQLSEYVQPPSPLQLVNGRWEFQDANWFPDFAASGEKIAWFYEHSRGTTVDGVIAVNATVLERLLRVVGPLNIPDRGVTLSSETALAYIQETVERGEEKAAGKPKTILADAAAELSAKLSAPAPVDVLRLLTEAQQALDQKEIQTYFRDARAQDMFRRYGWTGEIIETGEQQDFLAVIQANLQGQKSDARMDQVIEHEAAIAKDGSIMDTVVIRRAHRGSQGEAFYGAPNWSYMRAYVPAGSVLLDAGGFTFPPEAAFHAPELWYDDDIDVARLEAEESVHEKTGTRVTREFGKTAFGNWVLTQPGETSVVYFTYRLPFRISVTNEPETKTARWESVFRPASSRRYSRYQLFLHKQSGADGRVTTRVVYPESWMPVWKSDDRIDLAQNGGALDMPFEHDVTVGILMQKVL